MVRNAITTGILTTLLLMAVSPGAWAEQASLSKPSFYKDVLPILQENCQVCHRPNGNNMGGMIAPMSLMTYKEVRPWAKAMMKQVTARTMPPWHASEIHHGQFANERTLTDDEIDTIARWVQSGAARGKPSDGPDPLKLGSTGGFAFGSPDLIVPMPEPYWVADDVEDLYVNFETEVSAADLPAERWIHAHQVRAGSSAVHHVISGLGSLVPGGDPKVYRDGYGRRVKPGQRVEFQMHYHKEPGPGTGLWDQTRVGLQFYEEGYEPTYQFHGNPMGNFSFRIPAGDSNYSATSEFTFPKDARLVSFMPHMHLRGKAVKIMAYYPDDTEEILLDVPKYDFNWQTTYEYAEYKFVPKGTRLHMTAWWDNSDENAYNPDSSKDIRWGRPTSSEMMFAWMRYTDPLDSESGVGEGDETDVAIGEGPSED